MPAERSGRNAKLTALAVAVMAMVATSPAQPGVMALFIDHMVDAAGIDRALFSLLFTIATLAAAIALVWIGGLIDRHPPGRIWLLGAAGSATALAAISLVHGPVLVVVAFFLARVFGMGAMVLLGFSIAARTFHSRRGRAMAIAIFGLVCATIIMPPVVERLIDAFGWRDTSRVLAGGVLAFALPALLLLRRAAIPPPHGHRNEAAPRTPAVPYPPAYLPHTRLPFAVPGAAMRRLLVIAAMPALIVSGMLFHAVSVLAGHGLTAREAALALSVQGFAGMVGLLGWGAVIDRLSTRVALGVSVALVFAAPVAALVVTPAAGFAAFILVGLGGANMGVTMGMVWPRLYGTAQVGRLQATATAVTATASALGPLPLAASYSLTGSFNGGLLDSRLAGAAGLLPISYAGATRLPCISRPSRRSSPAQPLLLVFGRAGRYLVTWRVPRTTGPYINSSSSSSAWACAPISSIVCTAGQPRRPTCVGFSSNTSVYASAISSV